MSDERIPEARPASEEPAAIRAPAEQAGPRPIDGSEAAPRKRRRRGSRGGRNRRRPAAANANGGTAGGQADVDTEVDLGEDRPLTSDDVAVEAREDAGLDGQGGANARASSSRSRPGGPAPRTPAAETA